MNCLYFKNEPKNNNNREVVLFNVRKKKKILIDNNTSFLHYQTMGNKFTRPNWCNLSTELLHLIIKNLAFVDIIRFKAVCKSWCLAANSYISSPHYSPFPRSPWLMLPYQRHQNRSRFFNFTELRVYKLDNVLKGFDHNPWCAGSSHGGLIIFYQRRNSFLLAFRNQ